MPSENLKVLAIDDDLGDAELLHRHLENITVFDINFVHAISPEDAREKLVEYDVDVIFLDHLLGAETGLQFLDELRSTGDLRPVIAMTGHGDAHLVRDLMNKGADDYLSKSEISPELLRRTIDGAINRFHRRRLEAQNNALALVLKSKNETLEKRNIRLAELYETAHEFVDNVSHEFRTPLTVIKEFTSILNDGLVGEVSSEQKEYLVTVLDRVDDLATMIDDMLDISKLEAGLLGVARKVCSVEETLGRVLKTLERRAACNQIKLVVSVDESVPMIYCDPEKIGRVIINLAINAFKFSNEGSEVLLWVKHEQSADVIQIGVTDYGPGIDPEKVTEIFDRFQQLGGEIRSSTKGFGLGLNIARELVHLNFGDIEVTSQVGEGSTFSFTVPTSDPLSLVHRFLDRIEAFRSEFSHVSLITVSVDESTNELARMDVERFVQHQIRKSDVLLASPVGGWVIVAASNQEELTGLVCRIESAHRDANRNRPGTPLPDLSLCAKGTWHFRDDREKFLVAFRNELSHVEPMHA